MIEYFNQTPAAVKVAAFFAIWVVAWLPVAIPLAIALQWHPSKPLTLQQKLPLVLSLYAIAPVILWGAAHLENLPFTQYGISWEIAFFASVLVGIGLGVLGLLLLFGFQLGMGWSTWQSAQLPQFWAALLPTLVLGIAISMIEELVFRGFVVNQLQQGYPLWLVAIASSLIFALLHLVWEGWAIAPQLPGLWLMGMVLVLARWAEGGSLAWAIGLHAAWIWGMASLDTAQMLQPTGRGSSWFMGANNQPLAGLLGLALLGLTGAALWLIK